MKNLLRLELRLHIRDEGQAYGGLEVNETLILKPRSFMEVCNILGRFDELAKRIKDEEGVE